MTCDAGIDEIPGDVQGEAWTPDIVDRPMLTSKVAGSGLTRQRKKCVLAISVL